MRQTSLEAYSIIKRDGLLGKRQQQIYECLYNHGPMNSTEIFNMLGLRTNQSGRLTELLAKGVIFDVGKKKCDITGYNTMLWDVTSNLPVKSEKQPGKPEAIEMIRSVMTNVFLSSDDYSHLKQIAEIINKL